MSLLNELKCLADIWSRYRAPADLTHYADSWTLTVSMPINYERLYKPDKIYRQWL